MTTSFANLSSPFCSVLSPVRRLSSAEWTGEMLISLEENILLAGKTRESVYLEVHAPVLPGTAFFSTFSILPNMINLLFNL